MEKHPIQSLMETAMESIRTMVDVNTVVGDAVETKDGTVIIPLSRVSVGFAAGGGEFEGGGGGNQGGQSQQRGSTDSSKYPQFAGGSGAGVTVQPVGFLVVTSSNVRLIPVSDHALYDRLIDLAPEVMDRLLHSMSGNGAPQQDGSGDGAFRAEDFLGSPRQ